jgi:hypothetical protein
MTAIQRSSDNSGVFKPRVLRPSGAEMLSRRAEQRLSDAAFGPRRVTLDARGYAAQLAALGDPANVVRGINTGVEWLRKYREANWPNLLRGLEKIALCEMLELPGHFGTWYARHLRRDGDVLDYGLVSARVVTTVGAAFLIDAWQNSVEIEIMRFHGIGTTNTAEAVGDTGLAAEVTAGLSPDNTRATGSLAEGAGSNTFRSVATNTVDSGVTIVEAGIFSQAATGGGTMFDRGIFGGLVMAPTDQLETTWDWTCNTGG